MRILREREFNGKEWNAFNIRSPNVMYTVKVTSEPIMVFRWDLDQEYWVYDKRVIFNHSEMHLEPNEIAVEIPMDSDLSIPHKPHITDMSHPKMVYKFENAIMMVAGLPEPACAMKLKTALLKNKKRGKY